MSEIVFSIDKFYELLYNDPSEMINGINVYRYALDSLTDTNGNDNNNLVIKDVSEYLAKQYYHNPNNIIKYLSEYVLSIIIYKTIKSHSQNTDAIKSKIKSSWNKLVELIGIEKSSLDIP